MRYYFTLFIAITINLVYGQNEKIQEQISWIDSVTQEMTNVLPNCELRGFGSYNEQTLRYDSIYYYFNKDQWVMIKVFDYGHCHSGKSRQSQFFYYHKRKLLKYRYYQYTLWFNSGYQDDNRAGANERIIYIDSIGNCIRKGTRRIVSTIGKFKTELKENKFFFTYGMYCSSPQDEKYLKQIEKAEVIRPQKKGIN